MARRFRVLDQSKTPPSETPGSLDQDEFLPEAEVYPLDTPEGRAARLGAPKDEAWESLFHPEEPPAAVTPLEPPRLTLKLAPGAEPQPALPAPVTPTRTSSASKSTSRPAIIALAVVVAVVVSGAALGVLFGGRVLPAIAPKAETPSTARARPPAPRRSPATSRKPGVVVTNPITEKPVEPAPLATAPAATMATPTLEPATPEPEPTPPPQILSQGSVLPAVRLSPGRLSAPPDSAPAPPALPGSAPFPATRVSDTAAVESLLARYRSAYATLNASAVQAVWPGVNVRALDNAFQQLETQTFTFDDCRIEVNAPRATAACSGTAQFVPKVGSTNPRVEARRWTFSLLLVGDTWTMERVESR